MITLTPLAIEKVKNSLKKRNKGVGIRIGVKTTGCSGFAYVMEYIDNDKYSNHLQVHLLFLIFGLSD